MRILSVASEIFPLIKTGGLADVVGALPLALKQYGCDVTTIIPGYTSVLNKLKNGKIIHEYKELFGEPAKLISYNHEGLDLIIIKSPNLFERDGGPYSDANGKDWDDNWKRFAALSLAAADLIGGIVKGLDFQVLHSHDWQAALAPVYLRFGSLKMQKTPSIITIHNITFQGRFNADCFKWLNLPDEAISIEGLEYYGDLSYLKGAIAYASKVTTVSPTYAREILDSEFGMGLEGLIWARENDLIGILNGIDNDIWNPEIDEDLPVKYNHSKLSLRKKNRAKLEEKFNLTKSKKPIFCVISRLTWQKGIDVLIDCFDDIINMGGRIVVLGAGDKAFENAVLAAAERHKGKIGAIIGYDEKTSHLMQGAADAILIPSRFEPCGLTQLYGLKYGCVPIVARTGGLADSIIDANTAAINTGVATGFQLSKLGYQELLNTIGRAIKAYYTPKVWSKIQTNGMKADFSWKESAKKYKELYESLISK